MAAIKVDGKKTHLGYFDDEDAAARAYDELAARAGKPTNFAVDGCMRAVKGSLGGASRFKGVSRVKRDGTWHVQISIDGKKTSLGYFNDEDAAARAYDMAAAPLGRPLNLPHPSSPSNKRLQSAII
jgi:hypothetical protein